MLASTVPEGLRLEHRSMEQRVISVQPDPTVRPGPTPTCSVLTAPTPTIQAPLCVTTAPKDTSVLTVIVLNSVRPGITVHSTPGLTWCRVQQGRTTLFKVSAT